MTETIRLCTWNVQFGMELNTIIQAIQACSDFEQLDLLALQEVSIHAQAEDALHIAQALGPTYEYYQVTAQHIGRRVQANALVWNSTRMKVVHKGSVKLPHMHADTLPRTERALLRKLPLQQRISVMVEGKIGQETLRVYVAHLDVVGFQHKREQFYRILQDAQERPPVELTIIAGDLNTFKIRSRPSWKQLTTAAAAAGFQDLTSEIRWTHSVPRLRLKQKLDAIFIKYAHRTRCRSWSLDIAGSDHIPVFAEIVSLT